ncbi:ATP-binding protein [Amycolatopsis sp. lyj-108]|uniref:ATP-binding protein n=1 Tax=Amycolatopsis sp. lyj-108 TaxID=2789286 RepID=UPI00397B702A
MTIADAVSRGAGTQHRETSGPALAGRAAPRNDVLRAIRTSLEQSYIIRDANIGDLSSGPVPCDHVPRRTLHWLGSMKQEGRSVDGENLRNVFSGVSSGVIVQARDLYIHQKPTYPRPRQLPPKPTKFTGRSDCLAKLDYIITQDSNESANVAAIVGQPGVGKTALAIYWAYRVQDRFSDGQLYVDLRGHDASGTPVEWEDVLEDLLRALGGPEIMMPTSIAARTGLYHSMLSGRQVLLVLDNALSVEQVRPLIPGGSGCCVIVTSRNALPGLVARDGAQRLRLDVFPTVQATELLANVLDATRTPAASLERLADLCGGLPLALRIAAEHAASSSMHIDDLLAGLSDERSRLDSLTLIEVDAPTAVRTVFSWSFRTLSPAVAQMFRLLGLWPGSDISLDAAAALAGTTVSAAGNALRQLANAHLVDVEADRFRIHDLLRAYAKDMAEESCTNDERELVALRLIYWYMITANAAEAAANHRYPPLDLKPSPIDISPLKFRDSGEGVAWLAAERANLLAIQYSISAPSQQALKIMFYILMRFADLRYLELAYTKINSADAKTIASQKESINHLKEAIAAQGQSLEHNKRTIRAQNESIEALKRTIDIQKKTIDALS